jgi:hypothetical protein
MNGAHRVRYLQVIEKIEPKRIKLERGSLAKIGQNKASTASAVFQSWRYLDVRVELHDPFGSAGR